MLSLSKISINSLLNRVTRSAFHTNPEKKRKGEGFSRDKRTKKKARGKWKTEKEKTKEKAVGIDARGRRTHSGLCEFHLQVSRLFLHARMPRISMTCLSINPHPSRYVGENLHYTDPSSSLPFYINRKLSYN